MCDVTEIQAKSLLRKQKKIESWFLSRYGLNLYRGCSHNCIYCDGRAEKYNVEGDFEKDIAFKINALELLDRELSPKRKRIPLKKGFILPGGGVGDSYQKIEEKYKYMPQIFEIIDKYGFSIHILTKSTLVERDIELLKKINERKKVIVSFSFSTSDDKIAKIFEPGVPPPSERFRLIDKLKKNGIISGIFLMPVIPFISDGSEQIEDVFKKTKVVNGDYIIFAGMTLKEGRQKDFFYKILHEKYPQLIEKYNKIYKADKWGSPIFEYYKYVSQKYLKIAQKYKIPGRIPTYLVNNELDENDLLVAILEQIDSMLKLREQKSPYAYSAYSISQLKNPIRDIRNNLQEIKGIGNFTAKIINEILDTGTSVYYEKVINWNC